MPTESTLRVKPGKELTRQELAIINVQRKAEFNFKHDIQPKPNNEDWNKLLSDQSQPIYSSRNHW